MPLTKNKKDEIVKELSDLLASSKMTVVVKYEGTTVKAMQELRRQAEENGTIVKVVKNRLVQKAFLNTDTHKDSDTSAMQGMLMYAFNTSDEVAPAQVIYAMAKSEPQLEFIGAFSADGKALSAEEVKALAVLPSREVMIATVINTLKSPVNGVMSGLKGNLHGLLDAVATKAQA
ncbi:MAG: 50S ribosomal protein L10 [Candidatus Saccharibacteria bacterium]|nr:50S ribosomal protein L10 [Candidatus Saccharibacteria bacterium]